MGFGLFFFRTAGAASEEPCVRLLSQPVPFGGNFCEPHHKLVALTGERGQLLL